MSPGRGPDQPRRLLLLRHAKSSWDQPDLADHERPLAPRGRRAAQEAARHIASGPRPDVILVSSARRTKETAAPIVDALGGQAAVKLVVEDALYGAGPDELLDRLRRLPGSARCALLVGHNPGIEELARGLLGPLSAPDLAGFDAGFPTGALVRMRLEGGGWSELGSDRVRFEAAWRPSRKQ